MNATPTLSKYASLAACCAAALIALGAAESMHGPKVGDTAPPVELEKLQGKKIVLADQVKESSVVVLFLRGYPGYQCPVCTKQVGQFVAAAEKFKAANARVLMIYPGPSDGLKAHADEFVEGKGLPEGFNLVIDPDYTATEAWHLRWNKEKETAYPSTYLVDGKGVIQFAKSSITHGDRATAEEVLAAIKP